MSPSARRLRLLARIHRRYATITEPIRIGEARVDFTRIADPNRVLDEVAAEEDRRDKLAGKRRDDRELHLPYWAELWDSSLAIIEMMAEGQGSGFRVQGSGVGVQGSEVQGSGVGVQGSGQEDPSLSTPHSSLSSLNPEPRTLNPPSENKKRTGALFSSLNPEPRTLNPPSVLDLGCGMGLAGAVAAAMGARVLFADLEPDALLFARLNAMAYERRVRTRRLNWQTARLAERFDLIIGADILYDKTQWPFLEPFWRGHLRPGGSILLGEPGRQTGDLFLDWIKPFPWEIAQLRRSVPTRSTPIRLLKLTASKPLLRAAEEMK